MDTENYTSVANDNYEIFTIQLPYFLGDCVKTYDTGRFIFRGQVSGYTITDDGIIVHVSEHNTHKTYGFLPAEIQFDNDYEVKDNGNSNESSSEECN